MRNLELAPKVPSKTKQFLVSRGKERGARRCKRTSIVSDERRSRRPPEIRCRPTRLSAPALVFLLSAISYQLSAPLWAAPPAPTLRTPVKTIHKEEAALFKGLTLSITGVGIVTPEEKRLLTQTIEREKSQVLRRTMEQIYEQAYEFYRKGEYQDALNLLERIVALDPTFDRARALHSALSQMSTGAAGKLGTTKTTRQIVEERFHQAIFTYRDGRKVEAVGEFEEVLALEPRHRKAKYYIAKINTELAQEYFERGKYAYTQGRLEDTLEAFYNAINLDPKNFSFLTPQITEMESEIRLEKAKLFLTEALNALNEGRWADARQHGRQMLKIDPTSARAQEIVEESLRSEAQGYFALGDALVSRKKYQEAVDTYEKVIKLGRRQDEARKKIELAKSKIRVAQEEVKRREEEKKAKSEAEERASEAMGAKEAPGPGVSAQPTAGVTATSAASALSEEAKRAAESHYSLAMQYYANGDLTRAIAELNIALKFDPNNQTYYTAKRRTEAEMTK